MSLNLFQFVNPNYNYYNLQDFGYFTNIKLLVGTYWVLGGNLSLRDNTIL